MLSTLNSCVFVNTGDHTEQRWVAASRAQSLLGAGEFPHISSRGDRPRKKLGEKYAVLIVFVAIQKYECHLNRP